MVTTLLAIALLGDITPAPNNRKAYDQRIAQYEAAELAGPERVVQQAKAHLQLVKARGQNTKSAHEDLALAIDTLRLVKMRMNRDRPKTIPELTLGGQEPHIKLGKLRSETWKTIYKPGRGYYPERTRKNKKVKVKSRYVVVQVLGPNSMMVVEHYWHGTGMRKSRAVQIDGLPTRGAVTDISEINIGGKFFEVNKNTSFGHHLILQFMR